MINTLQITTIVSTNILFIIFIGGHIIRSIILRKGLSISTMKMYSTALFLAVLTNLTLVGEISQDILKPLLCGVGGFIVGENINGHNE